MRRANTSAASAFAWPAAGRFARLPLLLSPVVRQREGGGSRRPSGRRRLLSPTMARPNSSKLHWSRGRRGSTTTLVASSLEEGAGHRRSPRRSSSCPRVLQIIISCWEKKATTCGTSQGDRPFMSLYDLILLSSPLESSNSKNRFKQFSVHKARDNTQTI